MVNLIAFILMLVFYCAIIGIFLLIMTLMATYTPSGAVGLVFVWWLFSGLSNKKTDEAA